ncbi:stage III sporulation protein AB [Oceanirhabdus sp. W0125-5]|uniref:stage III sporulation protein AB n=1 Tax=Oceanirhabdus sp. W0125-5 TaxID=2999116 RepID=UPI0022F3283E|nr:stage III sporulation protein AB [Oceanirhabdus sp. W0125-5]WBW95334.1 stage III sporulation protein AB [Oceanirhabdus sp. W0125-5]
MLNFLSYLIIILGSTSIGILYGESMKKRLNQLNEMDRIMLSISNEITYLMTPLPELFRRIADDSSSEFKQFFNNMSIRMVNGDLYDIFDAYKSVRDELSNEFYFKESDIKVIDGFFRNLGNNDLRGEQNSIEYNRLKMKRIIEEADKKLKKDYKLVTSLSFALGLVVVIIIV